MAPPDDGLGRLASMLASRADHRSVTTDRLAGTAAGVADLESPPVTHLVEGERPQFCFECHPEGVSVDDPDAAVAPERGGAFLFTDRRILLLLGLADGDEAVSLTYDAVASADWHEEMSRYRVELRAENATYHLWIPAAFDRETVARAVEYVIYRRKRATPDRGGDADPAAADSDGSASGATPDPDGPDTDPDGSRTVRERLERLGDAKSRGLLDEEEFQRRKEELLDERDEG